MEKKLSPIFDLSIFFFFVLIAIFQGYNVGTGDLDTYVPFVLSTNNPALFQGDLLIETIPSHPVYIWKMLGLFLSWFSLRTIFFAAFLLQTVCIIAAIIVFYHNFFGKNRGWILVLLMMAIAKSAPAIGRYGLNPYGYFHPGALAMGIALFAYVLMDRKQWLYGGLLCGLLFLLHPFTAIYAALFFGCMIATNLKELRRIGPWIGGVAFILIASPALFPYIMHLVRPSGSQDFDTTLWFSLVHMRMGHTFFIRDWVPDRFIHIALATTGLILFRKHPSFKRMIPLIMTIGIALMLYCIADFASIKTLLQLQLARCSYFIFIALMFFIAHRLWTIGNPSTWINYVLWVFACGFLATYPILENRSYISRWIDLVFLLGTCCTLLFLEWPKANLETKTFALIPLRINPRGLKLFLCTLMCLMVIIPTIEISVHRWKRVHRFFDTTLTTPFEDMQIWCRDHLPANAMVMTPFYIEGFRSFSNHPIYITYKDGAPHNYCAATIFRWWDRMQQFGFTLKTNPREMPQLYCNSALAIAKNVGIDFVVYPVGQRDFFTARNLVLYENSEFGIVGQSGSGLE